MIADILVCRVSDETQTLVQREVPEPQEQMPSQTVSECLDAIEEAIERGLSL